MVRINWNNIIVNIMKYSQISKNILDSNKITVDKEKEFIKELRLTLRLDYEIPAKDVRKLNDNSVIEKRFEIHSKPENRAGLLEM